ncbi:MAG: glutamate--cysteine ligase [Pirellulaceae bacterium]|nr:glutamate--cysteine ligase [Pirellulaceae bacterium]
MERLGLFAGYGVELEYMLVDARSLNVNPIADKILQAAAGELTSDYENGAIAWSNELALHVIEIKTNGPARSWLGLAEQFHANVRLINQIAAQFGARLMPTAMHPWMDPLAELKLWPHECNPVYEAYNRIFDCRGHGWANLQSTHLNLPFANDEEFGRLHAAIRLILPLLPAIAASSPIADGVMQDALDYRMEVYRNNSRRIPSLTGAVIPEPLFSAAAYDREIFQKIYRDIEPHDPDGILREPFLNSRGAIARFDRGAIEIRVLDVQECVSADVAICEVLSQVLKLFVEESVVSYRRQQDVSVAPLAELLLDAIQFADQAYLSSEELAEVYGVTTGASLNEVWRYLYGLVLRQFGETSISKESRQCFEVILKRGPLARRIVTRVADAPTDLPSIYLELCECLETNRMF